MLLRPRSATVAFAAFITLLLASSPARADWGDLADWITHIRLTGFLQPGFEYIGHTAPASLVTLPTLEAQVESLDRLGFTQSRARALALGNWHTRDFDFDFRLEFEGLPQPSLYDAYVAMRVALKGRGALRVVLGQNKAPFDRQIMVWDPDIQMISKSWMTVSEPGHQIGLTAHLIVPYANWLQVWGGVYNGEGRNQLENIDKNLMYVGRLALRPIGPLAATVESALGEAQLSIAGDVAYNVLAQTDADQTQLFYGADVFFAMKGFSAYGSFLYETNRFAPHPGAMSTDINYKTVGYNGQAGYLLPIPGYLYRRFEVVGRFQGIVRNDAVNLTQLADPNQAQYDITAGINYYQRGHGLKVQVNYDHFLYPKDVKRGAAYDVSSDALFVQISYKLE